MKLRNIGVAVDLKGKTLRKFAEMNARRDVALANLIARIVGWSVRMRTCSPSVNDMHTSTAFLALSSNVPIFRITPKHESISWQMEFELSWFVYSCVCAHHQSHPPAER